MSRSHMFGIRPADHPEADELVELAEFSNGHGVAPVIWSVQRRDIQGCEPFTYNQETIGEMWKATLAPGPELPPFERLMTWLTGWDVWVAAADGPVVADMIDEWLAAHDTRGWANHWPGVTEVYRSDLSGIEAVAIWHTTTSDNPFGSWTEAGYDRNYQLRPARYVAARPDPGLRVDPVEAVLLTEGGEIDDGQPDTEEVGQ